MKKYSILYSVIAVLMIVVSSCNNAVKEKEMNGAGEILLSSEQNKASCAFLTTNGNNIPMVSWIEIDNKGWKHFYFSTLDTATQKFSSPVSIPIEQDLSIHEEGMPKIAVKGDGSLFVMYETSVPSKNSRWGLGDIRYIQSFDGGKSWTSPKSVAPEEIAKGLSCNFSDLTRLSDGEIGITWLGTNPRSMEMKAHAMTNMDHAMSEMKHTMHEEGRPVEFAKTEGKNGMSRPILIDPSACQCCRTAVSSNKSGGISIAYRDLMPGDIRDISVSTSDNNGNTFSVPLSFSDDHWVVDGCPHDGPAIVAIGSRGFAAWFTGSKKDEGVNYAELDSLGRVIKRGNFSDKGRFIQLGLLPDGTRILAYNENYTKGDSVYSRIMVGKVLGNEAFEKEITPKDAQANYPVVQAEDNKHVVVAWSDAGKVYYRVIRVNTIDSPKLNMETVAPFERMKLTVR
ncbi:MAG: hypothetical protein EPN37_06155 [Chitinophagaceae bacterium]|nr:MAG: hypothetical protein EPN37_06155 [Chitinophagaceae bacterium]